MKESHSIPARTPACCDLARNLAPPDRETMGRMRAGSPDRKRTMLIAVTMPDLARQVRAALDGKSESERQDDPQPQLRSG
jgi:hypothetical protein